MKITNKVGLCIVAIWFITCTVLIMRFGMSNKSEFDPELRLSQAIMNVSFDAVLFQELMKTENTAMGMPQVFHIVQGNCFCEWLAEPHQKNLDKWSSTHQFVNHYVKLDDFPSLTQFIPSTPAVAAFDEHGKLIYLGPYSRGAGCFAKSGEVDQQLDIWLQRKTSGMPKGQAIIDTDASGCYCQSEISA